jgi:hypothetical protein
MDVEWWMWNGGCRIETQAGWMWNGGCGMVDVGLKHKLDGCVKTNKTNGVNNSLLRSG